MRLTDDQTQAIRQLARQVGGGRSCVRVFGSRLDDTAKGGDLDLLLELPEPVDNPCAHDCPVVRISVARHVWSQSRCATQRAQSHALEAAPDLAERVEAFVGRFSRLQDTVGDKLFPLFIGHLGGKNSRRDRQFFSLK